MTGQYLIKTIVGLVIAGGMSVLALGLMFGVSFAVMPHSHSASEAMGRLVGMAALPVLGGSLLGGLAWPWPERRGFAVLCTLGVFGIAGGLCALLLVGRANRHEVTDAQRIVPARELIDGQPWLVQRASGFEMPEPPGLTFIENDPVVAQAFAHHDGLEQTMAMWRWASADQTTQITVGLGFERLTSEADAQEFFGGMVHGAIESLPPALGEISQERRGPLEHVLRARTDAATLMMRFFSYTHGDTRVFVSITAIDRDFEPLETLANAARGHE